MWFCILNDFDGVRFFLFAFIVLLTAAVAAAAAAAAAVVRS